MAQSAGVPTGSIDLHIVDGKRQPIPATLNLLLRVIDGRQKTIATKWVKGPTIPILGLPFNDSPADWYSIIVHADGYEDGAIYPVQLRQGRMIDVYVMLLPKDGTFHFPKIGTVVADPLLGPLLANGASTDPAARYGTALESKPIELGALFVIGSAIRDIPLATGSSPSTYYWEVIWDLLAPDRFWAWVDARLVDDIAKLADLHSFAEEPNAENWHPGIPGRVQPATRSWKQTRFDVSNVQLTFHESNSRSIAVPGKGNVDCVIVEPDIDYYRDLISHGLAEVLPNLITGGKSDPRQDYCLRWTATKLEGIQPDFDPLVTVE